MADPSPTSAPANYNDGQTISVYSTAIYQATFYRDSADGLPDSVLPTAIVDGKGYGVVPEMLNLISDAFSKIYGIWDDLKLSWAGDSADAAQKLQADLNQLQKRLYGAKLYPIGDVPGVIGQMSSVAASAAVNYSNVEESNADNFNKMNDAIEWQPLPPEESDDGSGDGSGDTTPPSNDSWDVAPVSEIFR